MGLKKGCIINILGMRYILCFSGKFLNVLVEIQLQTRYVSDPHDQYINMHI